MLKRAAELPVNLVQKARGGVGEISIQPLLQDGELQQGCKAFGKITLPVGSAIGQHQHVGDVEAYYIISGTASVQDDESSYQVTAGDLIYTGDGHYHAITNNGPEVVEFIGLVLKA